VIQIGEFGGYSLTMKSIHIRDVSDSNCLKSDQNQNWVSQYLLHSDFLGFFVVWIRKILFPVFAFLALCTYTLQFASFTL